MYDSTFEKMPSFWYGLNRPAWSGREKSAPPVKAAPTSSAVTPRRCGDIDETSG